MNRSLDIKNLNNQTVYEGQHLEISGKEIIHLKEVDSNLSKHLKNLNIDTVKIEIHDSYPKIGITYDLIFLKDRIEVDRQSLTDELFLRYILRYSQLTKDVPNKVEETLNQTYSFLNLDKKSGESIYLKMNDDFIKDFFKPEASKIMVGKQWTLKITPKIKGCYIQDLTTYIEKADGSLVTKKEFKVDNEDNPFEPMELFLSFNEHSFFLKKLEKYTTKHQLAFY